VKLSAALLTGALLLAGQTCFAEDQWAGPMGAEFGSKARAELNRLGLKGRTAFKNALIACGLYVDEISDPRKEQCKAALKTFEVEFSNEGSAISLLFDDAQALIPEKPTSRICRRFTETSPASLAYRLFDHQNISNQQR
jgi:hypothetical protein